MVVWKKIDNSSFRLEPGLPDHLTNRKHALPPSRCSEWSVDEVTDSTVLVDVVERLGRLSSVGRQGF